MNPVRRTLRTLSKGYTHEPDVTKQLNELNGTSKSLFWARVGLIDSSQDYVKHETLVCLIRDRVVNNEIDEAWKILEILTSRMKRPIARSLYRWISLSPDQSEQLSEAIIMRMYETCLSTKPVDEFWEIRFKLCLDRMIIDEARKRVKINSIHADLSNLIDEEGPCPDQLDVVVDSGTISLEQRAELRLAILSLPDLYAKVIYLFYFESWTETEIAKRLEMSTRTVGNYKRRAEQLLKEWRMENEN